MSYQYHVSCIMYTSCLLYATCCLAVKIKQTSVGQKRSLKNIFYSLRSPKVPIFEFRDHFLISKLNSLHSLPTCVQLDGAVHILNVYYTEVLYVCAVWLHSAMLLLYCHNHYLLKNLLLLSPPFRVTSYMASYGYSYIIS